MVEALDLYYLNECGLELLPFSRDYNDYDQLIDVLEEFAREMPSKAPMVIDQARRMQELLRE